MCVRQQAAHELSGLAGIDEIVDDQKPLASAATEFGRFLRNPLQHLQVALLVMVIACDADRIDDSHAELARDDCRRHQPAAGDRDHRMERPDLVEPPGQRPAIPVELVPRHRKRLARPLLGAQRRFPVHQFSPANGGDLPLY
jgi:hypothetical protein